MATLILLPLLAPLALAAPAALRRTAAWSAALDIAAALLILAAGVALLAATIADGPATVGPLRADPLAAFMLTVIGAVGVVALWGGLPARRDPAASPDGAFTALVCLFLSAMSLAVLADDLGILWVAVEATTITTAFLVNQRGGPNALEAAWKYVVLGSVGVAVAFLGIVLLYAAARAAGTPTLSWVALASGSIPLDPALTRMALALAALGFATKAGLAPMHSWLPDAHSQTPAPVSGLMSGVLLSVALYAILRIQAISDTVLGPGFMRGLLVAGGLLSLAVAAALMLTQRDYKRLLAYSSIEHMGLMALAAAAGGALATSALLLHMLGHGLIKAAMFVLAGRILAAEGTSKVADVRDLLARRPDLARPFLAGTAALLGFPPFVLFFTEVAIVIAGWQSGLGLPMAIALGLLLVVFAGLGRHVSAMTISAGPPPATQPTGNATPPDPTPPTVALGAGPGAPVALALAAAAALGFLAVPLAEVLARAAAALGGGS